MTATEKVPFDVYLGEFETITKTNIAELRMFPDALEILMSYDYSYEIQSPDNESITVGEIVRIRAVIPKEGLGVAESIHYHPYDVNRQSPVSVIVLERLGLRNDIIIRCTSEEARRLYKILRGWILGNNS